MKFRSLLTAMVMGASCLVAIPSKAQSVDPCSVYLCMAGISGFGTTGGPACVAPIKFWHTPAPAGLAVYNPPQGFNPPASYATRRAYMMSCPGATDLTNAAAMEAILAQWGMIP